MRTIALLLALLSPGCAHRHVLEALGPDRSLAFGFIDMHKAPTQLRFVEIRHVDPLDPFPEWTMRTDHGLFYEENLPLGPYRMVRFGGIDAWNFGICYSGCFCRSGQSYVYGLPEYGEGFGLFKIPVPGLVFLGSWEYVPIRSASFCLIPRPGSYGLKPIAGPTEAELLERLLPHCAGTKWEGPVKARLEELHH